MAQGTPNFAITPTAKAGIVSVGDASRTAPVSPVSILTAGSSGSRIERIVMEPVGPTVSSVVRLWLYDGTTYHLFDEVPIQAGSLPTQGVNLTPLTLEAVTAPNLMPLLLPSGWSLASSVNDTQLAAESSVNSIAQAQTTGAAAQLNLNGTNVTAASATAVAAAAAPTANTPMTLASAPYVMTAPAQLSLTSASNVSAVNYSIVGRDATGALITETLAGPNANTVYSVNVYKAVLAIIPTSTNASTVSAGYSTVAGTSVLTLPSKVMLFSGANLSAVNFTIVGTTTNGTKATETLAGPNVGEVLSANTYASITTISSSAAVASNVSVGNPAILSGIKVIATGGSF
ncbi:hypothetical protein QF001_000946 [Paraburkholderia youngii]|uniref:hypothetical protein n=1 Tax=Paraburkholderia youngii TaxID=2782701 RepID=UPI003D1F4C37